MPFMATERWLMLGTSAGGDRQSLHEVVRKHSLAVADAVSRGEPNTLLERLASDPAFRGVPAAALQAELDPANYTGRAAAAGGRVRRGVPPAAAGAGPAARLRSRAGGGPGMSPRCAPGGTLTESRLPLPLLRRGKVREVYEVDAGIICWWWPATGSAPSTWSCAKPIPRKGAVLTQISAFWFELLADVFPSHYLTASTAEILARVPRLDGLEEQIAGRAMLVLRAEPVPFECVVRGYHHRLGLGRVPRARARSPVSRWRPAWSRVPGSIRPSSLPPRRRRRDTISTSR